MRGCLQDQTWFKDRWSASPRLTKAWVAAHKTRILEQPAACSPDWRVFFLRCLRWSKPHPDSSAGLCSFWEADLVSESLQFCVTRSSRQCCHLGDLAFSSLRGTLSFHCLLWEGGALWTWLVSGTYRSYPELFTVLLKEFLCRLKCFNLWGNCYTTKREAAVLESGLEEMRRLSIFEGSHGGVAQWGCGAVWVWRWSHW